MESILVVERENEAASFLETNIKKNLHPKGIHTQIQRVSTPEEALELLGANHSSPMISAGKITMTKQYDLIISSSFYDDVPSGLDLWKSVPLRYQRSFMFHTRVLGEELQNEIQRTHRTQIPIIEKYNAPQLDACIKEYFRI